MAPGAKVVLVDTLLEADEADPIAVRIDLHMLTQCDGRRQRSVVELSFAADPGGPAARQVRRTGGPARIEGIALGSPADRAERGCSGPLYPQSALAGLNARPRIRPSGPVRRGQR